MTSKRGDALTSEIRSRRFYLVRHGTTDWNSEGRMQGHTDVPLNEEGREQARRVAVRIASLPEPPAAVWSSDLARARVTATTIAEALGVPVQATPDLRETMLGLWEGLNHAEIVARGDGELLQKYLHDSYTYRPPEGESLNSMWARMLGAQDRIRKEHPEGSVVIVAHGSCLRSLICATLDAPVPAMRAMWLDNASLSILHEMDKPVGRTKAVVLLNDVSHLTRATGAPLE